MRGYTASYLHNIGLEVLHSSTQTNLIFSCVGCEEPAAKASLPFLEEGAPESGGQDFKQSFEEAYDSALTKFDSLEAYFMSGMLVPAVADMVASEMQGDMDFAPFLAGHEAEFQLLVRNAVGRAFGGWKKDNGKVERIRSVSDKDFHNPLPWSSIDAYPDWVVSQVQNYTDAPAEEKADARRALEVALLEKPLRAAAVKYDGTCFGKMDTGELVGRRHVLGKDCSKYVRTSTAAAAPCDVAALRCSLSALLGNDLGRVCVWGELMCNPGFYGYKERGLASSWICFGAMMALDSTSSPEEMQRISKHLRQEGLAYSMSASSKVVRLLLCPALRNLLSEVAGCRVAEDQYQGLTHAEVVSRAAESLRAGENEGLVMVFERPNGEASLRKWKNSAEGGNVAIKHAKLLFGCWELCTSLVSKGELNAQVADMVKNMCSVAAAYTNPAKKGWAKLRHEIVTAPS